MITFTNPGFTSANEADPVYSGDKSGLETTTSANTLSGNLQSNINKIVNGTTPFTKAIVTPSGATVTVNSSTATIDFSTGNVQVANITTSAATTITVSGTATGGSYVLQVKNGVTTSGVAVSGVASTLKWPGGIIPTFTTISGSTDLVSVVNIGGTVYASCVQDLK